MSVVTAGSGDTYRIERVYIDLDETYGSAQYYRYRASRAHPCGAIGVRCPAGAHDGPGGSGGRGCPSTSVRQLRHTRNGERRDDVGIRRQRWPGRLPESKSATANCGLSKVEVAGLSNKKVTETMGIRLPSSEPIQPESSGTDFRFIRH